MMMTQRTCPTSAALLLSLLVPLAGCGRAGNRVGRPAPPIRVVGWVNGRPEVAEGRTGQVTVIDFAASW